MKPQGARTTQPSAAPLRSNGRTGQSQPSMATTILHQDQTLRFRLRVCPSRASVAAAETEKLDYFSGNLGIDRSYLPGRVYPSKDGRTKTARYFVDKFPLFLSGAHSAAHAVVCFATSTVGSESHRAATLIACSTEICSLGWARAGRCMSQRVSPCLRRRRGFSRPCAGGPARFRTASPSIRKSRDGWIIFTIATCQSDGRWPRSTSAGWTNSAMS